MVDLAVVVVVEVDSDDLRTMTRSGVDPEIRIRLTLGKQNNYLSEKRRKASRYGNIIGWRSKQMIDYLDEHRTSTVTI